MKLSDGKLYAHKIKKNYHILIYFLKNVSYNFISLEIIYYY